MELVEGHCWEDETIGVYDIPWYRVCFLIIKLFNFVHVYVYMFMCCVCLCVLVSVHAHDVWRPQVNIGFLPQNFSILFF